MLHAANQRIAFQFHDALITIRMLALIDGKGQVAFAHEVRGRFDFADSFAQFLRFGQTGFVKTGAGADFAVGSNVNDNH